MAPRRDVDALARGLDPSGGGCRRYDERIARQGQDFVGAQFDWERATARLEAILAAR